MKILIYNFKYLIPNIFKDIDKNLILIRNTKDNYFYKI